MLNKSNALWQAECSQWIFYISYLVYTTGSTTELQFNTVW